MIVLDYGVTDFSNQVFGTLDDVRKKYMDAPFRMRQEDIIGRDSMCWVNKEEESTVEVIVGDGTVWASCRCRRKNHEGRVKAYDTFNFLDVPILQNREEAGIQLLCLFHRTLVDMFGASAEETSGGLRRFNLYPNQRKKLPAFLYFMLWINLKRLDSYQSGMQGNSHHLLRMLSLPLSWDLAVNDSMHSLSNGKLFSSYTTTIPPRGTPIDFQLDGSSIAKIVEIVSQYRSAFDVETLKPYLEEEREKRSRLPSAPLHTLLPIEKVEELPWFQRFVDHVLISILRYGGSIDLGRSQNSHSYRAQE